MKKLFAFLLSIIMIVASLAVMPFSALAADGTYHDVASEELKLVNDFRQSADAWYWNKDNATKKVCSLKPLNYSAELEGYAKIRAKEIAESYSHTRPDGTSCFTVFGKDYLAMAENIAKGQTSAFQVFTDWQETDNAYEGQGHRRNMLTESCDSIGVACFEIDGVKYWVQEFGRKSSGSTHTHRTLTTTTKASTSADGKVVVKCQDCGKTISTTAIKKVSTVKLAATSYTYDGKAKTPALIVKDSAGKALVKGTDYTVSYASGRKAVGKYSVKITFAGKYSGSKALSFVINPKGTAISKLTPAKAGFKATWKKQATQTTGYQIRYSTSSSMSKAKTVTISKNGTVSSSVSKLSKGKKYYVQVRTYKTVSGTKYYSAWSAKKTVTTKK